MSDPSRFKSRRISSNRRRRQRRAFTMVEMMIVVVIAGILLNIAMPNLIHARESARARACVRNLRNIDGVKEQYALDTKLAPGAAGPDLPTLVGAAGTTGYLKSTPVCPSGGAYSPNAIGTTPLCGIGANINAKTYDDHLMP